MVDEKELNIDWHGPFYDAMQLELKDEKGLEFYTEHTLNSKPIRLDLLIIRKNKEKEIKNEIGKIFRGHNIFEYKSPEYQLGIDAYFKTLSYACLYKADTGGENEIDENDVTISLVREGKPKKLIKWFKNNGYEIEKVSDGVYYVKNAPLFKTQILVLNEMQIETHLWLKALTKNVKEELSNMLIKEAWNLKNSKAEKFTDSIVYVVFERLRKKSSKESEGMAMYEKTMSLFKDYIDRDIKARVEVEVAERLKTEVAEVVAEKDNEILKKNKEIAALKAEIELLKKAE